MTVARKGDASIAQVAKDLGISESCLRDWLSKADVEDGRGPRVIEKESPELRELRRRNRLLEQENEVLRRAGGLPVAGQPARRMVYPLVRELAVNGIPVAVTFRVLKLACQLYYRRLASPVGSRDLDRPTW